MIKAVFFDAIKTLFAPYPSEIELYQNVVKQIADIDVPREKMIAILEKALRETEILDSVQENSIQQWEYYPEKIAALVGCEKEACAAVGEKLRFETWGNPSNYRLYDDVIPTLELIKAKGLYIACISNEDGWLPDFFAHFRLNRYFSYILASADAGYEKPHPKIFEKALAETGQCAEEILFVGDSFLSDYLGSSAMGMKAVLIDRKQEITDDSIITIANLKDIKDYL